MRQQNRGDANVIVDDLRFGKADARIENLVPEIGNPELWRPLTFSVSEITANRFIRRGASTSGIFCERLTVTIHSRWARRNVRLKNLLLREDGRRTKRLDSGVRSNSSSRRCDKLSMDPPRSNANLCSGEIASLKISAFFKVECACHKLFV